MFMNYDCRTNNSCCIASNSACAVCNIIWYWIIIYLDMNAHHFCTVHNMCNVQSLYNEMWLFVSFDLNKIPSMNTYMERSSCWWNHVDKFFIFFHHWLHRKLTTSRWRPLKLHWMVLRPCVGWHWADAESIIIQVHAWSILAALYYSHNVNHCPVTHHQ